MNCIEARSRAKLIKGDRWLFKAESFACILSTKSR